MPRAKGLHTALATITLLIHSNAFTQASVDMNPPVDATGSPIATSLDNGGGGMCWGDPSADGRFVTSDFGSNRSHGSSPHAGVDFRAYDGSPVYAVSDGCVSFGNPTPKQLVGVKIRINDKFPNSSVWYLHMSRVAPKFINDGRAGQCIPIKKGELVGYSGNHYGTRGNVNASGAAHLHLSYYVSGLMLNPAPIANPPASIPAEYNNIKGFSNFSNNSSVNDSDASGTRGSKLGFAVPRMCNSFTVNKYDKPKTIPYDGNFGVGNFTANATAPTREKLEEGAAQVRESLGFDRNGMADASDNISPSLWNGGLMEAPDWESYKDMSYHQILHAEVARRNANSRWTEELTRLSKRGVELEHMRLQAVRLSVQHEYMVVRQRAEAMLAAYLAAKSRNTPIDPSALLEIKQTSNANVVN